MSRLALRLVLVMPKLVASTGLTPVPYRSALLVRSVSTKPRRNVLLPVHTHTHHKPLGLVRYGEYRPQLFRGIRVLY
jgi:hypothetical protein